MTAAVPFATYLNGMHNRIHPIFADSFLGSLDSLPATHPMNDPKIFTSLEIVLTPDGNIVKMGVTKTSGITATPRNRPASAIGWWCSAS